MTVRPITNIPLVDLRRQYMSIKDDIDAAMETVIGDSAFVGGDPVIRFEEAFAEYTGSAHCVGVGNGTDALELVLHGLKVGSGDEVIVPTMTFAATAEAVVNVGATPVIVDCNPATLCIDVVEAERLISPRTRVIMPVHLYGQPADLDALAQLAADTGCGLVEDAAQAHGALWRGRPVGSFGVAAAFSFYPGKNLGAYGDGGAVVTTDDGLADRVRRVANHGRSSKYVHAVPGRNSRLDGLQAAVLHVKLKHLDAWNAQRRALAALYRERLGDRVRFVTEDPRATPVYHMLVVEVPQRDRVQAALRAEGIATGIHYPVPLHRQPAFQQYIASERRNRTWAMDASSQRILSLPIFPELDPEEVDRVARVVRRVLGGPDG